MKKNFKRWLALFLAIALVATSAVYTSGTSLKATSEDLEAQTEQQADGTEVNQGQAEGAVTDPGAATQATDETGAEQEIVVDQTAPAEQTPAAPAATEQTPEVTAQTPAATETTATEEAAAVQYDVIFHKPAAEGGTAKLWADGAEQKDVSYDGNGIYTEKFTEGTLLNFQITTNDKYTVEQVTDQNGVPIAPQSVNEKVYTYQMFVSANTEITTLYKEVPQTEVKEPAKEEEKAPAEETKKETTEDKTTEEKKDTTKDTTTEEKKDTTKDTTTEEKAVEYTLIISHILETSVGKFRDEQQVKLSKEDFIDGSYDVLSQAYDRAGIVLSTEELTVKPENFNSQNQAAADIIYTVAEGYEAEKKSTKAGRSIYQGSFEDVEIVAPAGEKLITITFTYSNGTLAEPTMRIMAKQGEDKNYTFSYTIPEKTGYELSMESTEGFVLEGNQLSGSFATADPASVDVKYKAQEVNYQVINRYQSIGKPDEFVEDPDSIKTLKGEVGEIAEATAETKEGFTAKAIGSEVIEADGSTKVYIDYIRKSYQVTYDSMGGSYVSPVDGVYEEIVTVTGNQFTPQRDGYKFEGWFTSKDFTKQADVTTTLTGDVTVYAKWEPGTAKYRIAYFREVWGAGGNQYVYTGDSVERDGIVGTEVRGGDEKSFFDDPKTNKDYKHYEYNAEKSVPVKIEADGRTVIPVYYSLVRYTLVFNAGGQYSGDPNGVINKGGNASPTYTMADVVLGQDISDIYPNLSDVSFDEQSKMKAYAWVESKDVKAEDQLDITLITKRFKLATDMISLRNYERATDPRQKTFWYDMRYDICDERQGSVRYWLEKGDKLGTYAENTELSQSFPVHKWADKGGVLADKLYQKPLYGYTILEEAPEGYDKKPVDQEHKMHDYDFYYQINRSTIEFYDGKTLLRAEKDIVYGTDISKYNFTPEQPAGDRSDYNFDGWYIKPECVGEPFKFGTMPDGDLALYANWVAPEKTVTLNFNYDGKPNKKITVTKGEIMTTLESPEREGYRFGGWYDDEKCTKKFDASAPIKDNKTIYAKWVETTSTTYTVKYVINGKDGNFIQKIEKTFDGILGDTVSVKAMVMSGEYASYSDYVVDEAVKTLKLKGEASKNVIEFVYVPQQDIQYKVQYTYNKEAKAESKDWITSPANIVTVAPDSAIIKDLNKRGYALNENFVDGVFGTNKDKNIVTFTLKLMPYSIEYQGVDEVTGWVGKESSENPNKTTYTMEDADFTLTNPIREGYEFTGWELAGETVESDGIAHDKNNTTIQTGSKGKLVFKATWKELTYTVEYDTKGGTEVTAKTNVKWADKNLIPSTTPTKEGYILSGWFYKDTKVEASKSYGDYAGKRTEESITLVARWQRDWAKVSVDPYTGEYDGNSHSVEVNGVLAGETVAYSTNENGEWLDELSYKDVTLSNGGKYPVYVRIIDENQDSTIIDSFVKINPRQITIKADDADKPFDGTPLTKESSTITNGTFVDLQDSEAEGFATVTVVGSQFEVGESPNKITAHTFKDNTNPLNYMVDYKPGTLLVTPCINKISITVESKGGNVYYNGEQQSVEGFVRTSFMISGKTYTVEGIHTDGAKGINVREYPAKITGDPKVYDAEQKDVTEMFEVTLKEGKLVINQASAKILAEPKSKAYGDENPTLTYKTEGFKNGETPESLEIVPTMTTTAVKTSPVGSYPITFEDQVKETLNYKIEYVDSFLAVTENADVIVIIAKSPSKQYDGKALTSNEVDFVSGKLADGDRIEVTMTPESTITNAGTIPNVIKSYKIVNAAGTDVTSSYKKFETQPGTLTVTKVKLTITAESVSKEYGAENPELQIKQDEAQKQLVNGEKLENLGLNLELETTAAVKSPVDSYPITFKEEKPATNYEITYESGTLTVTPSTKPVVITANSDTKQYDGTALKKTGYHDVTGLASGDKIDSVMMESTSEVTNVSTVPTPNKIKSVIIVDAMGQPVNACYSNIEFEDGELKITPAPIKVQAKDTGKVEGQTDPELKYTITQDSKVEGEKADFDGLLTRTDGEEVGTYDIQGGSLKLKNSGTFLAANYLLTVLGGKFEIVAPKYSVTKTLVNEGSSTTKAFAAGETAEFEILVKNESEYAMHNVVVEDKLTGGSGSAVIIANGDAYTIIDGKANISELPAKARVTVKAEYEITQDDIDKQNTIKNVATVISAQTPSEDSNEVKVDIVAADPKFFIEKTISNLDYEAGDKFAVGETVDFQITVKNAGNVTLTGVEVRDTLEGAELLAGTGYTLQPETIDGKERQYAVITGDLAVNGSPVTVNAQYIITQKDVDKGGTTNTATVTGKSETEDKPVKDEATARVDTIDGQPAATAEKQIKYENDIEKSFAAEDRVDFIITVKNDGKVTLSNVILKEVLSGALFDEDDSGNYTVDSTKTVATVATLPVGESVTLNAHYIVTQQDIDNTMDLEFVQKNTVTITATDPQQKPVEIKPASVPIPLEAGTPSVSVTKAVSEDSEPKGDNGTYKADDVAKYIITVTNDGTVTLKNIPVKEDLEGATFADGKTEAIIDELAPGESKVLTASYTVTQADIDKGITISNTATATVPGTSEDKPSNEADIKPVTQNSKLSIEKTITNSGLEEEAEGRFAVEETAKFNIQITNEGNTTLTNVIVNDILPGAVIEKGMGYDVTDAGAVIAEMKPQDVVNVAASYKISQADVDNGNPINTATVEGKGPGNTDPADEKDSVEVQTVDKKPAVIADKVIVKNSEGKDDKFQVGDTVLFHIIIENTGNVTLKDVTVAEQLAEAKIVEDEGKYTVLDNVATIKEIKRNDTAIVKASYKVTQEDIDRGTLENVAVIRAGTLPEKKVTRVVPVEQVSSVKVEKSVTSTPSNPDGTYNANVEAKFMVKVTNNGTVTLHNILVNEILPGATFAGGTSKITIDELAPGAVKELPVSYTVSQEDIDKGATIRNTATATLPGEQEPTESNPAEIEPVAQNPKLTSTKNLISPLGGGVDNAFRAEETAYFEIIVENTGNVTLHDVFVKEMPGAVITETSEYKMVGRDAKIDILAIGQKVKVKAQYTVTQADVDKGGTVNIATVTGEGPGEKDPTENNPSEEIPTDKEQPDVITTKEVTNKGTGKDDKFQVGDTVLFNIKVANEGNITLTNVKVSEERLPGTTIVANGTEYTIADNVATIASIAPKATVTVKAQYTVKQSDVDSGKRQNIATITNDKIDPKYPPVDIVTEEKDPKVSVVKKITEGTAGTGDDGSYRAGETATFDITVTNNGNVTLKDIPVKETLSGATFDSTGKTEATILELAPDESETLTASYTVTQADIDSGKVIENIATATATAPETLTPEPEPSNPVEIMPEPQNPEFSINKTINNLSSVTAGEFGLGQTVGFDIVVKNTGNVTLKDIWVTDELAGANIVDSTDYDMDGTKAYIKELQEDASVLVKAEYKITQADVDRGGARNTASVKGSGPNQKNPADKSTFVDIITVEKVLSALTEKNIVANKDGKISDFKVGDTVLFDIVVENTGTGTLKNVVVEETLADAKILDGDGYTVADNKATIAEIAVNDKAAVRASYVVTQADMNKGEVTNTADVTIPGQDDPQKPQVSVPLEDRNPSVKVDKKVTSKTESYKAGETATFTITVTNNGNVTLTDIPVKETLAGATFDSTGTAEATIAKLAPGEDETLTASYTVTQADIDSGKIIENIATATAPGTEKPDPSDPTPITPEPQNPSVVVNKTVTNTGTGADETFKAGETAEFNITVTNNGNVTLTDIPVKETLPGATFADGTSEAIIARLAPEESATVTASYTVTQDDIDKGEVIKNIATAKAPGTSEDKPSNEAEITPEAQNPAVTIAKAVTEGTTGTGAEGTYKAGDTVHYTITVTNSGNVTLKNIPVEETLEGATFDTTGTATATIDSLSRGESATLAVSYTVTQEDIDTGRVIENIATATAPGTTTPEETDPVPVTPEAWSSSYTSVKAITNEGTGENGAFKAGEQALFTITVSNTGNTTLSDITVADQLEGAAIVSGTGYTVNGDGDAVITSLAPNNTAVVYARYTVTQTDVENGGATNVAAVTAKGPEENQPDPQNPSVEIPTDTQTPDLTTSKSLTNEGTGEGGAFKAGETATFEITVTNSGNVTQNNITVAEGLDGAVILEGTGYTVENGNAIINELAAEASVTVNAEYTITQADIDSGATIINTAIVDAGETNPQDPQEPVPTERPDANLGVSKTITNAQDRYLIGDTIQYQITASNDGNVTLNNVVINDRLANASGNIVFEESDQYSVDGNSITINQLAPGASIVINCSYTVTRADAGNTITNTAVGTSDEATTPKTDTTDGSTVGELYILTIRYVDTAGATMAPNYVGQFGENEEVATVESPTIDGYTMDYASITLRGRVMPAQDLEFTVTYAANPVVTPITPPTATPTPVTPVTPTAPTETVTPVTPAGPTLVTIQTTPVPAAAVDVVATPDENGDYVLTPVADVDTPLANTNLDDHTCCVLHFLLMLLALLILIIYTRSMKKRQARIFKLEQKLRIEMAKRGLEEGKKDAK